MLSDDHRHAIETEARLVAEAFVFQPLPKVGDEFELQLGGDTYQAVVSDTQDGMMTLSVRLPVDVAIGMAFRLTRGSSPG